MPLYYGHYGSKFHEMAFDAKFEFKCQMLYFVVNNSILPLFRHFLLTCVRKTIILVLLANSCNNSMLACCGLKACDKIKV